MTDFWIQGNNGKKEHLNDAKSGVRREQVDKKHNSLFNAFDANNDGILGNDELNTVFNYFDSAAGTDKTLDANENKNLSSVFYNFFQIEDADFMGFVKSITDVGQEITSHGEYATQDGCKEVVTTYKDGTKITEKFIPADVMDENNFVSRIIETGNGLKTIIQKGAEGLITETLSTDATSLTTLYATQSIYVYDYFKNHSSLKLAQSYADKNGQYVVSYSDGNTITHAAAGDGIGQLVKKFNFNDESHFYELNPELKGKIIKVGQEIVVPGILEANAPAIIKQGDYVVEVNKHINFEYNKKLQKYKDENLTNLDNNVFNTLNQIPGFEFSDENLIMYLKLDKLDRELQTEVLKTIQEQVKSNKSPYEVKNYILTDANAPKVKLNDGTTVDINLLDPFTLEFVDIMGNQKGQVISFRDFIEEDLGLDISTGEGKELYNRIINIKNSTTISDLLEMFSNIKMRSNPVSYEAFHTKMLKDLSYYGGKDTILGQGVIAADEKNPPISSAVAKEMYKAVIMEITEPSQQTKYHSFVEEHKDSYLRTFSTDMIYTLNNGSFELLQAYADPKSRYYSTVIITNTAKNFYKVFGDKIHNTMRQYAFFGNTAFAKVQEAYTMDVRGKINSYDAAKIQHCLEVMCDEKASKLERSSALSNAFGKSTVGEAQSLIDTAEFCHGALEMAAMIYGTNIIGKLFTGAAGLVTGTNAVSKAGQAIKGVSFGQKAASFLTQAGISAATFATYDGLKYTFEYYTNDIDEAQFQENAYIKGMLPTVGHAAAFGAFASAWGQLVTNNAVKIFFKTPQSNAVMEKAMSSVNKTFQNSAKFSSREVLKAYSEAQAKALSSLGKEAVSFTSELVGFSLWEGANQYISGNGEKSVSEIFKGQMKTLLSFKAVGQIVRMHQAGKGFGTYYNKSKNLQIEKEGSGYKITYPDGKTKFANSMNEVVVYSNSYYEDVALYEPLKDILDKKQSIDLGDDVVISKEGDKYSITIGKEKIVDPDLKIVMQSAQNKYSAIQIEKEIQQKGKYVLPNKQEISYDNEVYAIKLKSGRVVKSESVEELLQEAGRLEYVENVEAQLDSRGEIFLNNTALVSKLEDGGYEVTIVRKNGEKVDFKNADLEHIIKVSNFVQMVPPEIMLKDISEISKLIQDAEKPAKPELRVVRSGYKGSGVLSLESPDGEVAGIVQYSVVENSDGTKSLHFEGLKANQKGQGIGTQLIEQLTQISKDLGAEGRLEASASIMEVLNGKPMTNIGFYYKLGFRAVDPKIDAQIRECIAAGKEIPINLNYNIKIEYKPADSLSRPVDCTTLIQKTTVIKNGKEVEKNILNEQGEELVWQAARQIQERALETHNAAIEFMQQSGLLADNKYTSRCKKTQSLHDKLRTEIVRHPEQSFDDVLKCVLDSFGIRTINKSSNIASTVEVKKMLAKGDKQGAINTAVEAESDYVLQNLKKIVDKMADGTSDYTLIRIANHVGADGIPYFTQKQLSELSDYATEKGVDLPIQNCTHVRKSGYTALQMNFKSKDGDIFEWQFRGEDVNEFAEGEHIPYDLRMGKDIIGENTILTKLYEPIKELLSENSMDDAKYKEYNDYLTAHYKYLREVELGFTKPGNPPELPEGFDVRLKASNLIMLHDVASKLKSGEITIEDALNIYDKNIEDSKSIVTPNTTGTSSSMLIDKNFLSREITSEISEFDILTALGAVNAVSEILTPELASERGLVLVEEIRDDSGIEINVYNKGNQILVAVNGFHGSFGDVRQGATITLGNLIKVNPKITTLGFSSNKQVKVLDGIYSKYKSQAESEGKQFILAGYSLGGAMTRLVASKHMEDNSTRFITFNSLGSRGHGGRAVENYCIIGDDKSNPTSSTKRLLTGAFNTTKRLDSENPNKHCLDAFLDIVEPDISVEAQQSVQPGLAVSRVENSSIETKGSVSKSSHGKLFVEVEDSGLHYIEGPFGKKYRITTLSGKYKSVGVEDRSLISKREKNPHPTNLQNELERCKYNYWDLKTLFEENPQLSRRVGALPPQWAKNMEFPESDIYEIDAALSKFAKELYAGEGNVSLLKTQLSQLLGTEVSIEFLGGGSVGIAHKISASGVDVVLKTYTNSRFTDRFPNEHGNWAELLHAVQAKKAAPKQFAKFYMGNFGEDNDGYILTKYIPESDSTSTSEFKFARLAHRMSSNDIKHNNVRDDIILDYGGALYTKFADLSPKAQKISRELFPLIDGDSPQRIAKIVKKYDGVEEFSEVTNYLKYIIEKGYVFYSDALRSKKTLLAELGLDYKPDIRAIIELNCEVRPYLSDYGLTLNQYSKLCAEYKKQQDN